MEEARKTELVRREQVLTLVEMAFKNQKVEKRAKKYGVKPAANDQKQKDKQAAKEREQEDKCALKK